MNNVTGESQLIYEIMQELGRYGAVFRTNAGSIRLPNGKVFHGLPKGFADIMAILPGNRTCFIECKVEPNKPTPEQEEFLEKMRNLGCRAGVAYSVLDACRVCGLHK